MRLSPIAVFREVKARSTDLFRDRSGNIAIIAALGAIPLILAIGIAVDYSRASSAKSDLQEAVDAAVLAGARDATTSWTTVAGKVLTASVKTKDFTVASSIFSTDASGNYVGTAAGTIKTTFAALVSVQTIAISATATVAVKAASDKACILLLNTSASPGLLLNSGAVINAPNCQVHVKSTGNPAATFNASTTLSTKKICLAGTSVLDNGGTWNGTGVTFYFPDTSYIQFNGTMKLNLSAPTSGTYSGLLMYEASGLSKTSFSMNATNGANLSGLLYLPSRGLTLNSGASVTSNNLTMVLDTLIVNQANWTLDSADKSIPVSGSSSSAAGVYLKK